MHWSKAVDLSVQIEGGKMENLKKPMCNNCCFLDLGGLLNNQNLNLY